MATNPQGNQGQPLFGPSDRLITMFRACSRDPTEAIKTRLRCMLQTFLQHHRDNAGNETTNDLAAKCCCGAGVWYYTILEKLISGERSRLGISDISVILENELLHCCLVACCMEITISSTCLSYDFPQLLHILKLAPYHFLKVIELVLRAEVGLPHAVIAHLAQAEEKILESLAWTSDSPLWEEIRANEGRLPTCQQVMLPAQDPERTDFHPDRTQPGPAEPSASTDQQDHPAAANRPRRTNSLHLFARKVYSLMAKRLVDMCAKLEISEELQMKIWTCFESSLVDCTELSVERHLHQLLMCAIYIMAKVTNADIPFKIIMKVYKSLSFANKSVFKNVLISTKDGSLSGDNSNGDQSINIPTPNTPSSHYPGPHQEERGNLIHFYNHVYTTRMHNFTKQFSPTSGGDTPPLSPFPRQRKPCPHRQRLSSSHSVHISPHSTESTFPHTPGLSYFFNSSPSERLREINNMIRMGRLPNDAPPCSLDRVEEDEEDGPSVKRLRLDGQSAWQRRLKDVADNRVTRYQDQDQDQHQHQDQHQDQAPVTRPNLH